MHGRHHMCGHVSHGTDAWTHDSWNGMIERHMYTCDAQFSLTLDAMELLGLDTDTVFR